MSLATVLEYTYSGNPTFPVNFSLGYIHRDYIQVRINKAVDGSGDPVYVDFTWQDDSNITVTPALTNGDLVEIYRTVPKDSLTVSFSEGDNVSPDNLDNQALQGLMIYEEVLDGRIGNDNIFEITEEAVQAAASAKASEDAAAASESAAECE